MTDSRVSLKESFEITAAHPAVQGHFPGLPIYPGVAQIHDVVRLVSTHFGRPIRLQHVDRTKFLSLVRPPTMLHLVCEVVGQNVSWEMTYGDQTSSRGQGTFSFADGAPAS